VSVSLHQQMEGFFGGIWKIKMTVLLIPWFCKIQFLLEMENLRIKFLEVLLLNITQTQVLWSIWSELNKGTFFKQTKEKLLILHKDLDLIKESIMDLFILYGEIQVTSNIFSLLETGPQKYGARSLNLQLCKPDITLHT
jgi:hypothetical protein